MYNAVVISSINLLSWILNLPLTCDLQLRTNVLNDSCCLQVPLKAPSHKNDRLSSAADVTC